MMGDKERLAHMIDACEMIEDFCRDVWDRKTVLAVERCIEIIGEATKNLSPELKHRHSEIIWQDIVGMRNIIAHEYFRTQNNIIQTVALREIPKLHAQLHFILTSLPS